MFEAKFDDISLFRDSMSTIAELIDEAELHIEKDGIKILAADRTVVVVVNFFLEKDAFKEYRCEKETKIGLNLLTLLQVLRRVESGNHVSMRMDSGKLHMSIENGTRRNFTIPLIDISKTEVPQLEKIEDGFSSVFEINSNILSSGIDDAELIGDSVVLSLQKESFCMNSDNDSSETKLELEPGEDLSIIKVDGHVRARYSLDYMKKIAKSRKLSEKAKLSMATDYPLKIQFTIPKKLQLSFILAPRVEE